MQRHHADSLPGPPVYIVVTDSDRNFSESAAALSALLPDQKADSNGSGSASPRRRRPLVTKVSEQK